MTVNSIAFALDPVNVPSFLVDWELTKLCNLDCTYCPTGMEGGHDNTTAHPSLDDCLRTIDFMYQYIDLYMTHKKPSQRKAIINVYGGESLFHPDIVEILTACRQKHTGYDWYLTITCTTNAIVGQRQWARIVPLVDEFTMSYHAENLPKQKTQFKNNLKYLQEQNKRFTCMIMMHPQLWDECTDIVDFCSANGMRYVKKPLDNNNDKWAYTPEQFGELTGKPVTFTKKIISIQEGRQCCGGRRLSINGDLRSNTGFVAQQGFEGWSCSVNWFFLFIRQANGLVYTNKDCQMSTSGAQEPLGELSHSEQILARLESQLQNGMPIIKCQKPICRCGFCAPKAQNEKDFLDIICRNVPVDIFQKTC